MRSFVRPAAGGSIHLRRVLAGGSLSPARIEQRMRRFNVAYNFSQDCLGIPADVTYLCFSKGNPFCT